MISYTIFSRQGFACPWCARAIDVLERLGITINSVDLEPDQLKLVAGRAGMTTVPIIYFNGTTLVGGYEQLIPHLKEQGYLEDE